MPLDPRNYNKGADGSALNDDPYATTFGDDGSNGGGDNGDNAYMRPWPHVPPHLQTLVERKHFEKGATIHFDRLRGLQFWAPLFAMPDNLRVFSIIRKVITASEAAGRPLAAGEIDAISELADDAFRKVAWANPVTLITASAAAFHGRRTFKFPFYQPKMQKFNPYFFPRESLPLLRGNNAVVTWHILRCGAYVPLTLIASFFFFSSISDTSYQAHFLRDGRLSGLIDTIRQKRIAEGVEHGRAAARRRIQAQQHGYEAGHGSQSGWGNSHAPPPASRLGDSGAPQHGYGTTASERSGGATGTWGASPPTPQQQGSSGSQSPDWSSDPFEDDGSPVAPSARRAEAAQQQQQQQQQQRGSTWARLRQQAQSDSKNPNFARGDSSGQEQGWAQRRQDSAPNAREGPRDGSSGGGGGSTSDGHTYSRQDEERESKNYEKEQAQKEFDALIENERRGENTGRRR